jgi:very-short-patch-repair endonuclease
MKGWGNEISTEKMRKNTELYDLQLAGLLIQNGFMIPRKEYKFCPTRRWRFDYAFVEEKIALEIEGGVWAYGRHNRASGYIKDMEKYNCATVMGWKVLRYTPQNLNDVIDDLEKLKKLEGK